MIEQKDNCQNCNHEFKWHHVVPTDYNSGSLKAYFTPSKSQPIYKALNVANANGRRVPTDVSVHCPKCDYLNNLKVR